jgi:NADH-quinone oxidoreductase subunit N
MNPVESLFPALNVEVALVVLAVVTLALEALGQFRSRVHGAIMAACVFGLSVYETFNPVLIEATPDSLLAINNFVHGARVLCLTICSIVLLQVASQPATFQRRSAEHFVLVILACTGFNVSVAANDFVLLFVALELGTTASYVLVAQAHREEATLEAGAKYLIMGALSTAFLAMGLAYLIGTSGGTSFTIVRSAMEQSPLTLLGAGLVLGALLFKIAAFPAHLWAPDVYQGAPLPVTSLLATLSKAVGFVVLFGLLDRVFAPHHEVLTRGLLIIAALTVLWGNMGALKQTDLTRVLGYSSIAHSGYLLLATATGSAKAESAVMFYLVQYSFTNIAAFYALGNVIEHGGATTFDSLAGLRQRSPITAWVLTISLLSAAGIPPLSGFFGKFLLVSALPNLHVHGLEYVVALVCALFGIVVSIGYYFRAIRHVWLESAHSGPTTGPSLGEATGMFACVGSTLVLGVLPQLFWTDSSAPWSPAFTWAATGLTAFGVVVWWTTQSPRASTPAPAPAPVEGSWAKQ